MKIAIHSSDLESNHIDGTRVYMLNMFKYFGKISLADNFWIYFAKQFNKNLIPPVFPSYIFKKLGKSFFWTQTKFAVTIWKDNPDVLWMPVVNLPLLKRKKLKTVITVHDLAFKFFPEYFPKKDLKKLNFLADFSIPKADKIIAISQSTKKDILKFFPKVSKEKIKVIHHGFDSDLFNKKIDENVSEQMLKSYKLKAGSYLLYVGAIQPRKNILTLVKAFEKISPKYPDLKLVIVGKKAWMWEETIEYMTKSEFGQKIILTGSVPFSSLPIFYQNASVFVFPELYAGFGIPLLEAFASGVPVISANNSSLLEIGEGAALFFETKNYLDLSEKIEFVLDDQTVREEMIENGYKKAKSFSWEKCAEQTLDFLKS
jgi:glycosyltransferase involved in cell wall biosynthesis